MREAVIVAGARTAVGKSHRGMTRHVRSDEMAVAVIRELLNQTSNQLDPAIVDDVVMGCAYPEGSQGLNFARIISLRSGLPIEVPAMTLNRFCSSGLQAIAQAAERIIAGGADVIIAGGAESMSLVARGGARRSPNPYLMEHQPETFMNMGHTAERVANEYAISRDDMDLFAYHSHRKAASGLDKGYFASEIVPLEIEETVVSRDGRPVTIRHVFDRDEHLRRETTLEALARLKPAFAEQGRVTAGNSSPLSDGAAAIIVMEASKAAQIGLRPLARYVGFSVAGVRPEIMGAGPINAVPKLLRRLDMRLEDIDLIELNEAFASQALAVIRTLNMDPDRVNVNGGAIALGHPLGCTGAKLTVQLINEMRRRGTRYGMVTMCVGGGMGAAGVFEYVE